MSQILYDAMILSVLLLLDLPDTCTFIRNCYCIINTKINLTQNWKWKNSMEVDTALLLTILKIYIIKQTKILFPFCSWLSLYIVRRPRQDSFFLGGGGVRRCRKHRIVIPPIKVKKNVWARYLYWFVSWYLQATSQFAEDNIRWWSFISFSSGDRQTFHLDYRENMRQWIPWTNVEKITAGQQDTSCLLWMAAKEINGLDSI